jgi:hypothetical protein
LKSERITVVLDSSIQVGDQQNRYRHSQSWHASL